uniref:UBX domain-containing protein n=1 Tax=Oryza punctata TaxID=4537 RepID=A0A0E0KS18_ORYPU
MEAEHPHPHQITYTTTSTSTSLCPRRRKRGDEEVHHLVFPMDLDSAAAVAAAAASHQQQQPTVNAGCVRVDINGQKMFGCHWQLHLHKAISFVTTSCSSNIRLAEKHYCISGKSQDKLKALAYEYGHEFRVFSSATFESMTSNLPAADQEEDDDFYELQPADYFNLVSNRIGALSKTMNLTAEQSKVLKTRKMREAELAAQRAKIKKAVMRVRFPDGYILEANFHPSETVQSLMDFLKKVISRPDLPFYLYTVPPKKRIQDTSLDFYTIGFVPGANVFFSYDLLEGSELNTDCVKSGPYLCEEIRMLDGLPIVQEPVHQPIDSAMNSSSAHKSDVSQSDFAPPANKKPAKPKWFKRVLEGDDEVRQSERQECTTRGLL